MKTFYRSFFRLALLSSLFLASGVVVADSYGGHHGYGHGYGHGSGMMGMGGPGMGMTGRGPMSMIGLTDVQRSKINKISDNLRKTMWQIMGKSLDERARLRDLCVRGEKLDAARILAVHDRLYRIKREKVAARIQAHNAMLDVLTKEQREQLKNWHRGMPMGPGGSRGGMPGPGMMMH